MSVLLPVLQLLGVLRLVVLSDSTETFALVLIRFEQNGHSFNSVVHSVTSVGVTITTLVGGRTFFACGFFV